MAEKKKETIYARLPQGVAADAYVDKPDDTAPEGASWSPDGKYKVSIVYDDEAEIAQLVKIIRDAAKAKWGEVDFSEFRFPFKTYDQDAKREGFRGKTVVTSKTKFRLRDAPKKDKLVDSKKNPLPENVKVFGGDIIKAIDSLYLYEKAEEVREKINGKLVVSKVMTRGASLQLEAIQLIQKRAAGGASVGFDEEDGFVVSETDAAVAVSDGSDDF